MPHILIVEGNTPETVARGLSGAQAFVETFASLAPHVTTTIANPYAAPLAADDLDADGIVFTGSGEAWAVSDPEATPLWAAMEGAMASGKPIWGSCNGMHLAALALGGMVRENPNGLEVGIARDMALTVEGRAHPMMAQRPALFGAPCVHRDEVAELPPGAILMAGNAHTPIQAFAFEGDGTCIWATQYHPELSLAGLADYLTASGSIFADHAGLVTDLTCAAGDSLAAARLGTTPEAMQPQARAAELLAWLQLVTERAAVGLHLAAPVRSRLTH